MTCHLGPQGELWHRVGGYAAWRCAPHSGDVFDTLWISVAAPIEPHRHRVLPTGEPSLAIRRQRDAKGAVESVEIVVCATYDRAFWYAPRPGEELIAFRLKPEFCARILGIEAREYFNMTPAAPPKILRDRLSRARRVAERDETAKHVASVLASDLIAVANDHDCRAEGVAAIAARRIREANGRLSIGSMAQDLNVSDRHLRRAFRDAVGCGPKAYARRARLSAAAIAADALDNPDWAAIAAEAGYHDQQHMIGEFTELVGLSPARAHAERKAQSVFSNTSAIVSP
jgi:AraC-like DNA-binding protein